MPQQQNNPPSFIPDTTPVSTPEFIPDNSQPQQDTSPEWLHVDQGKAFKSGAIADMFGTSPGAVYGNYDSYDGALRKVDPEYDRNDSFIGALKTGLEETPIGMKVRGGVAEPFDSKSLVLGAVHQAASLFGDPLDDVGMILAAIPGLEGAGVGTFAADAALRRGMMDHYQRGDIKSLGELGYRTADVLGNGLLGAVQAKLFMAAGSLPVGSMATKPLAAMALRTTYQIGAINAFTSLYNRQFPTLHEFEQTAVDIGGLNLVTAGTFVSGRVAKQALMDHYAASGTPPAVAKEINEAQPPVKPDAPPGLRPAIKLGKGYVEGEAGDVHDDVAERLLGEKPVSMEQLDADPSLALKVLQEPEVHTQDVIDAAWIKWDDLMRSAHHPRLTPAGNEEIEAQRLKDSRGNLKSGRGFVTPEGKFLTREQAAKWTAKNEPETHALWQPPENGEFHAADYNAARERAAAQKTVSGDPRIAAIAQAFPELSSRLAATSKLYNAINASFNDTGWIREAMRKVFGDPRKEALRSQFSGVEGYIVNRAAQVRDLALKTIPDEQDQLALGYYREYKQMPQQLTAERDALVAKGDAADESRIDAMNRALNPSDAIKAADRQYTELMTPLNNVARALGIFESSIDPETYWTHMLLDSAKLDEARGRVAQGGMRSTVPQAEQRTIPTMHEAIQTGRLAAETENPLTALPIYARGMGKAIATNLFQIELENSQLGVAGTAENHPANWVPIDPRRPNFYAPKIIADAMHPIVSTNGLMNSRFFKDASFLQGYIKSVELGLSVFHMKSMGLMAMSNIEYADMWKAFTASTESPEFLALERQAAIADLETTKTGTEYEAYRGLTSSKNADKGIIDTIRSLPVAKQADALAKALSHETFDVVQRKFKVMNFGLKSARWLANHPDADDAQYLSAQRSIAKEVNATFGGLNWKVMGVDPTTRAIIRLAMLAPDWTFSNFLNAKYAVTDWNSPAGSMARAFWAKSFLTGFALTAAASLTIGGQMPDKKHWYDVYLGEDKSGNPMYTNWFYAGASKDSITAVSRILEDGLETGLAEFASYKLSPLLSIGQRLIQNKNWRGQPIAKKSDTPLQKTEKETGFIAGQLLPFTVQDMIQTIQNPENKTWKDIVTSVMGGYVQHVGEKQGGATSQPEKSRFSIRRDKRENRFGGKR
jgi:hypothetical protein